MILGAEFCFQGLGILIQIPLWARSLRFLRMSGMVNDLARKRFLRGANNAPQPTFLQALGTDQYRRLLRFQLPNGRTRSAQKSIEIELLPAFKPAAWL